MIIVVNTVDISLYELFLHEKADCKGLDMWTIAHYLTEALNAELPKHRATLKIGEREFEVDALEVLCPDDNGLDRFTIALSCWQLDDPEILPKARIDNVTALRCHFPGWLCECMDAVNGTKLNWS
jgi:hypothetical protein